MVNLQIFLKTPIGLWKFGFSCSLFVGATLCSQPPIFFAKIQSVQFEDPDGSVKILIKDEVKVSDNQTVIEETQYFDDSQFYTGLIFAIGAAVFGAIANILVSKCSSYSSLLLTLLRHCYIQYSYYRALHLLPPSTVSVIRVTEIIFAYVLQSIFMDKVGRLTFFSSHAIPPVKVPNTLAIVGCSLVILSVIGVSAENIFLSKFHNNSIYPTNH